MATPLHDDYLQTRYQLRDGQEKVGAAGENTGRAWMGRGSLSRCGGLMGGISPATDVDTASAQCALNHSAKGGVEV